MKFQYLSNFSEINRNDHYPSIRDNYFFGKIYNQLLLNNISIAKGFEITNNSFLHFANENNLYEKISGAISRLDKINFNNLKEIGSYIRAIILGCKLPDDLKKEIHLAVEAIKNTRLEDLRMIVQCGSEDAPKANAYYLNTQNLLFNISELEELYKACLKCYAVFFTEEGIQHRAENKLDHFEGGMSIFVRQMVRSDLACSGIIYSQEDESNFIRIDGCWGMAGNIFYHLVEPDFIFITTNESIVNNKQLIIKKMIGTKKLTLIYFSRTELNKDATFVNIETQESKQKKLVLNDSELMKLASWSIIANNCFGKKVNLHWAKDGLTNELYLVGPIP